VLEDMLPELSKARVFSTVDLKSGYWHCVLAPDSSVLTTFATPYGRYKWIRLPFGLSASSEIFQKHLIHALENLPGVLCIVDDILIYGTGETDEEATAAMTESTRSPSKVQGPRHCPQPRQDEAEDERSKFHGTSPDEQGPEA